jgi:hypothetical protein
VVSPLAAAVAGLAIIKATSALAFAAVVPLLEPSTSGQPTGVALLQMAAYLITGCVLLFAHGRDARTANLGVALLTVASAFSPQVFALFAARAPVLSPLVPMHADAFLPFFLGRFIQQFPSERTGRPARMVVWLVRLSLVAGVVLFLANLLHTVAGQRFWPWLSTALLRQNQSVLYWGIVFGLVAPLLAIGFTQSTARADERRRAARLWTWFALCLSPMIIGIFIGLIPGVGPRFAVWVKGRPMFLIQTLLAVLPIAVAHALVVDKVLPLRVVARQAVQYLFARITVTLAALVPLAIFSIQVYLRRDDRVGDVLSGSAITMLLVAVVSGFAIFWREDILNAIDRRFFRERYDLAEALIQVTTNIRRSRAIDELVARVTSGIELAMRPASVTVMVRREVDETLVSVFGAADPLPLTSVLAGVISQNPSPIDATPAGHAAPLRWLPLAERQWLVDSDTHLLLPLLASDGDLVGLISLGERRSELPYDAEDRRWLMAVGDAAALTLETHAYRSASLGGSTTDAWLVGPGSQHRPATECPTCGLMDAPRSNTCRACETTLTTATVPLVLFGKFKFECRVGHGGMGVVYRAIDLALDRAVAVKTLPSAAPEHAERLRSEARAMAAVTHRHLAVIYGAESWRGRPMLICEFMEGGTLAERLTHGPLPLAEAIALGIALAEGLEVIHNHGLLHRDIKPSNIGFDRWNVAKLLDFGLVHMFVQPGSAAVDDLAALDPSLTRLTPSLIGTPMYLSPEATRGNPPSRLFDLWSLNVLLYEAITGTHPFRGRGVADTLSAIRRAELPPPDAFRSTGSERVVPYFQTALARDASRRHRSAADVASALRAMLR